MGSTNWRTGEKHKLFSFPIEIVIRSAQLGDPREADFSTSAQFSYTLIISTSAFWTSLFRINNDIRANFFPKIQSASQTMYTYI